MAIEKSYLFQTKAIYLKNFQCSIRNKEIYAEIIVPIVAALVVSIKDKDPSQTLLFFSPILIAISAYLNPRSLLIHLVEEKSEKFKETQKIMGLKQSSYVTGWLLYSYSKTLLSAILFLSFLPLFNMAFNPSNDEQTMGIYNDKSIGAFYLIYILYALTVLNQSLFLSTFFSTPKLANEVSTFLTIISLLLPYLGFIDSFRNSTYFILTSILPQSCISYVFVTQQRNPDPTTTGEFSVLGQLGSVVNQYYPNKDAAIELGVLYIVFFILYFYLDQVFPNEYGVAKHPLFFLECLFSQKEKPTQVSDVEVGLIEARLEVYEDTSSAYYHQKLTQDHSKTSIVIRDLTRKFGDFTAVDHISLNLYSGQILCLLGHNGAGKTTTINLLTGLLSKTSGRIIVNGSELEGKIDKIRESFGICNQRDVLYDELTVYEQLKFMGRIKGLEGTDLDNEIQQTLQTALLQEERDKLTKALSGGNKRKLSLAQALIGGSSVVFLDEPTSGMDAMSRRAIWEILERVKQENRTLVLTTHHLDEAEVLADRITIMAAGKLLACGRCDYIKVNFGEGYQISVLIVDPSVNKDEIISVTKKMIPNVVLDPQSSNSSLLFQLPFKSKAYLLNYFEEIELAYAKKVCCSFKINSLEDAFINIGMDEEKFMERAKRHQMGMGESVNHDQFNSQISNDTPYAEQSNQIQVPQSLSREPQYIFKQQFLAIFLRKYYTTVRTFSNYLAVIIPFTLIIVGTLAIGQVDFDIDKNTPNGLKLDHWIRQLFISIFIIIAFCFNSSIFILQPVLERETNLKYALQAMGCRVLPYWLGTFAFDYLLYLIFVLIFLILSIATSLDFITDYLGQIFYLFFSFGMSFCFFSYFIGALIYRKSSRAMKTFPFFNYFVVFGLFLDLWMIVAMLFSSGNLKDYEFTKSQEGILFFTDFLGSMFSPFFGIYKSFSTLVDSRQLNSDFKIPQIAHHSYFYSTMMIFQGVMYFLLTILVESKTYNKLNSNQNIPPIADKAQVNDPQVVAEINRVGQPKPIRVEHLVKYYDQGGIMAVKDVTFAVEPNQILGLLGPSGAGKTTTFSILTSLIGKSSGNVKINNCEIDRDKEEIFRETGICPQFDCIWENLTPREHLYLFGRMKGLSGTDLDEQVLYYLATMQLEEYIYRQAGRLSGGNKRKLCVSNALIGGPSIQFFDEPSTGVDPIARRFLWKTLKQGVKSRVSSVVLTTHTMDEAESLCDRIAIMINGELYCIGTPKELKDRYGSGFNVQIKGVKNEEKLMSVLKKEFPSTYRIQDNSEEYYTIHIDLKEFKFFKVFQLMTNFEAQNIIKDFSVFQSTLESVFIQFSRLQKQMSLT